jgi:hypothetical protein
MLWLTYLKAWVKTGVPLPSIFSLDNNNSKYYEAPIEDFDSEL